MVKMEFILAEMDNWGEKKNWWFNDSDSVGFIELVMKGLFKIPVFSETRLWIRGGKLLSNPRLSVRDLSLKSGQALVIEWKEEDGTWGTRQAGETKLSPSGKSDSEALNVFGAEDLNVEGDLEAESEIAECVPDTTHPNVDNFVEILTTKANVVIAKQKENFENLEKEKNNIVKHLKAKQSSLTTLDEVKRKRIDHKTREIITCQSIISKAEVALNNKIGERKKINEEIAAIEKKILVFEKKTEGLEERMKMNESLRNWCQSIKLIISKAEVALNNKIGDRNKINKEIAAIEKKILVFEKKIEGLEEHMKMNESLIKSEEDKVEEELEQLRGKLQDNMDRMEELTHVDLMTSSICSKLAMFLDNLIREKEVDLECPVCWQVSQAPILMCREMHLICSDCRPRVTVCPVCRVAYRDRDRRHRYAENTAEELKKLKKERRDLGCS